MMQNVNVLPSDIEIYVMWLCDSIMKCEFFEHKSKK